MNPFHVRARRLTVHGKYVKLALQLYQVDYKSYLLDFKSLPNEDDAPTPAVEIQSFGPDMNQQQTKNHNIMEFFEMCSSLITQLAR